MLKIGLVGLSESGKTTLFNLLTEGHTRSSGSKMAANVGMATVPDPRIDFLSAMYKPKKTTYAQIEFTDIPGLSPEADKQGGNTFLTAVRNVDALVLVVRAFHNEQVPHPAITIDPARDLELLHTELLFADLEVVEKRIERLKSSKKVKDTEQAELELLNNCREILEGEGRLENLELTPAQEELLSGYCFLTQKPMLLVVNLDEEEWRSGDYPSKAKVRQYGETHGIPILDICAQTEMEIGQLPPQERVEFLKDFGITERGIDRLARATYAHLNLISFFTVGEDEVRAWTIQKDTNARKAAGKIHSDIERGFIKAEVAKYQHYHELGSMVKVKEKGLFQLEGKEYIMQDGDIVNFRFNV
jgi:GTP-binding protein YchF